MKPYYREATVQDALEVANNILPDDRKEIEGQGHSPLILPFSVVTSRQTAAFFDERGDIGGVAGIVPDPSSSLSGVVWMICTPVVQRRPHTFVREARRWLSANEKDYRILWNLTDARNQYHHKLLRLLGFKALRVVNVKPYFLPYLEIVRLCA